MSVKDRLTLAAGLAVALSASALSPLFDSARWLPQVLGAVLVVTLTGLATRRIGVPAVLQPVVALAALVGYLTLVFAGATMSYGLVPTGRTADVLRALVDHGRLDIQRLAPPVPANKALVLLAAGGVGLVAVLVDLVAVVLDRAAPAGLPLLLLLAVPSAVLPGGLGTVPFVLGAAGWLGLLLVEGSERVGRWGTPMRAALPGAHPGGDDSSLGRVGRRIGLAAVGMAVVVPALLPGLDHRMLGGAGGGGGDSGPSSATTYNPITRLRDQLALPAPRQLLVYTTDDDAPDYLRMTTLDQYSGAGWSASKLEADRTHARVQDGVDRGVGDSGAHRDLTMRIGVDGGHLDVHWLPVPFGPRKVSVKGTWLWDPRSQTVFSASRTTRDLPPYTVQASRALPDRDVLAVAQLDGIDADIARDYGRPLDVSPYVQELTDKVVAGKTTEYDKAVALQAYFRSPGSGFVYDLDPSQPRGSQDPLEAFLTGKHGFCEQYATAMAVMLRVAGIPSRVAVGFTAGTPVAGHKNTYSVTTSDAHAWPEAWFAGTGWVRFEPTPAATATVPAYSLPAATGPAPGNDPTRTGPTPTPASSFLRGQRDPDLGLPPAHAPGKPATKAGSLPSPWLLATVVAVVLAVLPSALTQVRRRRRRRVPDPLSAWDQLHDDARDVGFGWHPADSPRAAAARLAGRYRLPADALAALERITGATEQARYAPPGRVGREDLGAEVAVVRSALQRGVSAPTRLRAQLLPPSTLQWVAHGIGERVADVLDRVDDVIAAVTRPLRRRTATR
ncbi:MAG: DUF3488 and transglutaminase-like domain-containing protein [Mycobacteriales bacterium]